MQIKKTHSIQQIVEEQVHKWQAIRLDKQEAKSQLPIITISRQAGSGGHLLAQRLAQNLGLDLFDREIMQGIAESAKMRELVVSRIDEKISSAIEDMIAAAVEKNHLWRDEYFQHLVRVISVIEKHGPAIILGRGAHFILPKKSIFRVRTIAPLEKRIKNMAGWLNLPLDEARQEAKKIEADRGNYIKKFFHVDIDDSQYYDLVINMENLDVDAAVEIIKTAVKLKK